MKTTRMIFGIYFGLIGLAVAGVCLGPLGAAGAGVMAWLGRRLAWAGLVWMLISGAPVAWAASPDIERQLQQGAEGYAGVSDTWVSRLDWDTPPQHLRNHGQDAWLELSRDGGDSPLLRFDLGAIPPNSLVRSATLTLWNTTRSSDSGTRTFLRRVALHRVLRPWDEGNQVDSVIDVPGDHGATGNAAFEFLPGEGDTVLWQTRGMQEGADYAADPEFSVDVGDEGWHAWDLTELAQAWVRGEAPNFGLVLRDLTGWQEDHRDWRTFVSSQSGSDEASHRPRLTLVYNPSTPSANAGPDQARLDWWSGAVMLDGSGSRDRPGGDDASLQYAWRVVEAAYGSRLAGAVIAGAAQASFVPDAAGEWEIELTLTNRDGDEATDRVQLRLLGIPTERPRVFLTPARLAGLRARAAAADEGWERLREAAASEMLAAALVWQIAGDEASGGLAVAEALGLMAASPWGSGVAGDLALVYDWCHGRLTPAERAIFGQYFSDWAARAEFAPNWGNYWPRYNYSFAVMALAAWGEHAEAPAWLEEFRRRRIQDHDLPLMEVIAEGGGWPEGVVYDWIATHGRVMGLEAWRTGTGENLFLSSRWYQDRLGYLLLQSWPGIAEQWGHPYHPYPSLGDSERERGSMANLGRITALILIERFAEAPLARQLQAYCAAAPANRSMDHLAHEEFLWFNPAQPAETPSLLAHHARATGTIFLRSGWPDGAADADARATQLTFQCGDHFSYHQHYDQNSFTLFKRGDLLVDSGVYSGDGLSWHDQNYYVRTIAHNTLVVFNPAEDFSEARPDAISNDGGQRSVSPATRSPATAEYFAQHRMEYETGDLRRFEDDPRFTYGLGDATAAYNNPAYHQAMDLVLAGNVAKVTRFEREFVYLRDPAAADGMASSADSEYLVLFDRVGVARPEFSGANTKLLFHTLTEPEVPGAGQPVSPGETLFPGAGEAEVVADSGKLFLKILGPSACNLRKVGGRSRKAFWVFDDNYDWHWSADEADPRPVNDFENQPYGEWRLEIEPSDTGLDHQFLTVLHPTATNGTLARMERISATGMAGVHLADPALNRVLLFAVTGAVDGPEGDLTFDYGPTQRTLHLLFNLRPGTRYGLDTRRVEARLEVALHPDLDGGLEVSPQGVLQFLLEPDGTAPAGLRIDVAGLDATGTIRLAVRGSSHPVCVLEASTDLAVWRALATNAAFGGRWELGISAEPGQPAGYYRARTP